MKAQSISLIALACAALAGCSTAVDESQEIGVTSSALTLAECGTQRDACVRQFGFLGALTICPTQYTTCTLTASNGLPAVVTDAVADAANCTDTFESCVVAATTPSALTACAEDEAICVASILDVELPTVVTGTAECVDGGVDCINAAKTASDLVACGENLTECAADQVVTVIPQEVVDVVDDVTTCTTDLNACIQAATTPSQVTLCTEASAVCVAGSLDVTLPSVPVSSVVECTEDAADCTLAAESISDVTACADALLECTADVVAALDVPPVLDCGQVWTACMVRNPFGFFTCAAERRACDAARRP